MTTRNLMLSSLLIVAAACSSSPEVDPDAPNLGAYSADGARDAVKSLMASMELPEREQSILMGRLDSLLADPEVMETGVNGVAVYRYGAGGFILRGGHGSLMASFAGGSQGAKYSAGGMGIGFNVGGGASQGVILACGLQQEHLFAGTYSGGGKVATGGSVGVSSAVAHHRDLPHSLHIIATSAGLDASFGGGSVNIKPIDADEEEEAAAEES